MEDRDGKKPFTIPKTHTSSKDVLVREKPDSRNVTDLFRDIQSCALETHFNFRTSECKSCDMMRNPRLQKLFNERRLQMKKSADPAERFAFQIIFSRDVALQIATDGLSCVQTALPFARYLGNPTDGIHLSRRPDVLLASTGSRNLLKFGLLICKILVGKGYATVPAENNKELSAQLHYDHHFCKIQTTNKEQQHIDELLANSLIFCYEHDDMQTLSNPTQILPLAILWYDLTRSFSAELTPTPVQSQQRITKPLQRLNSVPPKRTLLSVPEERPPESTSNGTREKPSKEVPTTPPQYPRHCMIPISSLYTSFNQTQQLPTARDPRISRTASASETIPLSPQKSLVNQNPSPSKLFPAGTSILLKDIPLAANSPLPDPRPPMLTHMRHVCFLEGQTVAHALQQQRRLNQYYDDKHVGLSKKTTYTPIPVEVRTISVEEHKRQDRVRKASLQADHSSLRVSVTDCFEFGMTRCSTQAYIDLEDGTNQVALTHMQVSDQLIEHEKQLNSQERRLQLREQRQRKMQDHLNARQQFAASTTKAHITNGRKLLTEHQPMTPANNRLSPQVLDFFSREYQHENRPEVKRILAELLGIFVEKYGVDPKQATDNDRGVCDTTTQTNDAVVDMDIESPSPQAASDHDERFPVPPPVSVDLRTNEHNRSRPSAVPNNQMSSTDTAVHRRERIVFSTSADKSARSDNQSRDEFVKLLAKEACIPQPSSPLVTFDDHHESDDSGDDDDDDTSSSTARQVVSARTVTIVSKNHKDNLIIQARNVPQPSDQEEDDEPTVKRIKTSPVSSVVADADYRQDYDERSLAPRARSESISSQSSSVRESETKSAAVTNRPAPKGPPFIPQQRSAAYTPRPTVQSQPHQQCNYNHQSVAQHSRFGNVNAIPSLMIPLNQAPVQIPPSINCPKPPSVMSINQNCLPPLRPNPQYFQDNFANNLFSLPPPLMSTVPVMNFPRSHELKPSNTFEQLQMILQDSSGVRHEVQPLMRSDFPSCTPVNHSYQGGHVAQRTSTRFSAHVNANTTKQTNPTFSRTDANQLLTFVQHFRH